MGMTIAEKIIAAAAGVPAVHAGEIHTVTLDRMMSNDGTTHLTIDMWNTQLRHKRLDGRDRLVFIIDHNIPADCAKTAAAHRKMRDFAKEHAILLHEGDGVCHQILAEQYIRPGELVMGADSHTCTCGALGALGIGVGCTDFLYGMVTGKTWVMVPETHRFTLTGKLRDGVYPRDLILTIMRDVGADGCNYKVMEFDGDGIAAMSVHDRLVLTNLAVEAGAKSGIIAPDDKTLAYIEARGRTPKAMFVSDLDAIYEQSRVYDLSKIEPVVARPDFIDDVVPASDCTSVAINEAFLGSCNNGRIDELRVAATLLRGRKVHPLVRFLIAPASREVYLKALEEGLLEVFIQSGAMVMNPNCSVCWGSCQGVIGENEVLISTGTRNFKGRAGHPSSKVYLGSAATVTASAITGSITTADRL